jgi:hypothetical protein
MHARQRNKGGIRSRLVGQERLSRINRSKEKGKQLVSVIKENLIEICINLDYVASQILNGIKILDTK